MYDSHIELSDAWYYLFYAKMEKYRDLMLIFYNLSSIPAGFQYLRYCRPIYTTATTSFLLQPCLFDEGSSGAVLFTWYSS